MQLGLGQGSIEVSVYELPESNTVEIDTPNGALTLLGAGSYRVDSDPNNGTMVTVMRGSLQISGGDLSQTLNAGQAAQLTGTNPIQVNRVGPPSQDDFDAWCSSRDRKIESAQSHQYVNPYIPGAADLDDYGQWTTASEYGPVWYPAGVPAGWVPYRYGHWAWVEPWGWTWVEDEPWGFCPFHYGRWAFVGARWGWVPGPVAVVPVYSPALVAFVGGGGFSVGVGFGGGVGVAAWFPLGPSDPFIPWYHASPTYIRQVNVTNVRNVTVINNYVNNITTTNVNVTNIKYAYKTTAVTAVPANAFRSGQAVQRAVVHVDPQQIARAQVIAHPSVAPAKNAVFAGKPPVKAPPVPARRVTPPAAVARATAGAHTMPTAAPPRAQPPAATRPAPPPAAVERTSPPPATHETTPPATERTDPPSTVRNAPVRPAPQPTPPAQRPTFVTRTPPPTRDVPYEAHQPAYDAHPGRPLEPQQEMNIRQGRPAGPPQDREVLPHAAPPPKSAPPREESKPAPPPKNDKKPH
jgi:hypothetical protein